MKTWKGYNLLDLLLILIGIITITITSIIFHSQWYIILNTILGLLCVFTQAKGKIITQVIGIVWFCVYACIAYSQRYYGEVIVYIGIMLPMYVYGVIHWLKNRDHKEENTVLVRNNLSKKEWIISSLCFLLVSVLIYFILKVLNTSQLLISTLSFSSMLPGVYLLIRRCKWNQVAFLINDFIVPLLWILLVIEGHTVFITMCVYHIFQITYDAYGLVEWRKLEKKQLNYSKEEKE